jgi:anti-sigma B factor antagonist
VVKCRFGLKEQNQMKIREELKSDVAILTPRGELIGGPETIALQDQITELIADGTKNVVVDLTKVRWLNSSGIGVLLGGLTSLREAEGDLKLACLTERVESLLMMTKLITIFETFENKERAVASFVKG